MPTPRTLTLAAQSLRVNSRAPAQWLARVAMAAAALLALSLAWSNRARFGAPGLRVFTWHAWACLWLLVLGGAAFFPTAIAEEKEQRTLPLLRLAGYSPAAILLGRATGDLLTVTALLVAQLPIAVLAITLGGIAPVQVQAAGVLLLALTVFVHGTGVLCAVLCGTTARATATAVVLVLAILIALPLLSLGIAGPGPTRGLWALATLDAILTTGFSGPVLTPAAQAHTALGLLLDVAAWIAFRSQAGDDGASRSATERHRPIRTLQLFTSAVEWRDWRFLHGARRGVAIRLLAQLAMLFVVGALRAGTGSRHIGGLFEGWALGSLALVVLDLGISAGRAFGEDARQRTLDQIGMLPMSSREHVQARWGAYWRAQAPGLAVLVFVTLLDVGPIGLFVGAWFIGPHLHLLPYLTAWLTLKGWRGAFALAITGQMFAIGVVVLMGTTILGCCGLVGAVPIPMLLAHRLRTLIHARFDRAIHG